MTDYESGRFESAILNIKFAIQFEPDNDVFKEWLEKAVNADSKSPVILEHYGDVLYQLDQKKEALEYWRKAKNTIKGFIQKLVCIFY